MARAAQTSIAGDSAGGIAESVERSLRRGELVAGDALPPVRGLAETLSVSPTTVAAAYRMLRERGVVVTAGRRGTRIAPAPPVRPVAATTLPADVVDLATGNPDPAELPDLAPQLAALDPKPHLYSDPIHSEALLRAAHQRVAADGLRTDALCVVSGALDGIERVLAARLRPGDAVAVEDPGFAGVFHLLRALGLRLVPVAIDDAGPLPDALAVALERGARAVVVTPRAQNPTGAALSAERAQALRAVLAHHADVLVVEDDHCEIAAGAPAESLCGDATERFAIVRSVSKTLGPDLRVAIVSGDDETVARVAGRQVLGSRWVSHLLQDLVARLWRDRSVARGLARSARCYAERREALLDELAARGIAASGRSGLNVWIPVPEETRVVQALAADGWAVQPGELYRIASGPAVRVTTAALPRDDAPVVAEAFARVLGGRAVATTS